MKKTILSSSMLAILFAGASANAAFIDATGGAFNGDIKFSGTIVDTSPIWAFEVPENTKTKVKNWHSLTQAEGIISGTNTVFNFKSQPKLTLIQGYMKSASKSGGPGLTPVIKVGAVGQELQLDGEMQQLNITATGAIGDSSVDGVLSFNVQGFIGGAYSVGEKAKYFGAAEAQEVLNTNGAALISTLPSLEADTTTFAEAESIFGDINSKSLIGAYKVDMSNYQLSFPSANMPESWQAAVPVTVTLK